jgi:hypothetical protein
LHLAALLWCQVDQLHVLQHFPFLFPEHVQPNYRRVFAEPSECGTVSLIIV